MRTFKELMQFVLKVTERKRLLLPLPFFAAKLQAVSYTHLTLPTIYSV